MEDLYSIVCMVW